MGWRREERTKEKFLNEGFRGVVIADESPSAFLSHRFVFCFFGV